MARRTQSDDKRPAELTPAQLQAGIERVGKLVERVRQFDPQSVIEQHNIPHVHQLSAAIDDALIRTFGPSTLEYDRYRLASEFDNGPFNYAFTVPIQQVHQSLARSKARNIALLEQAIEALTERLAEAEPTAQLRGSSQGPIALSAENFAAGDGEEWISAASAVKLLKPVTSSARMVIAARANDGLIRCRAARLIRGSQVHDDVDVPPQFWWARGHTALEQNWGTGDFETWIDNREHWKAYGVRFLRSHVESMVADTTGTANPSAPSQTKTADTIGFDVLLHPDVRRAAIRHYQDGDYRNAVLDAITAVFDKIRERTGIDQDGDRLVNQVLSVGAPVLILSEVDTESGRNDQSGFADIFRGFYRGVRNPKAHSLVHDLDANKAGQHLVLASILMRRVVEARLVKPVQPNKTG
jgi:uncharacterized protein (TIGR02391 family)